MGKVNNGQQLTLHRDENGVEFFLSESYGIEDLKRVQKKSVEMLGVVVKIFEKNNIDYVLAHGTLLGLIRHGSFIPWDDDCDLFVFDWDYARAIELLRRELPDDMIVHNRRTDKVYWPTWTKIRDVYSDTYESLWKIDRRFKFHGICVDILRVTVVNRSRYLNKAEIEKVEKRIEKRKNKYSKRSALGKIKGFPRFFINNRKDKREILRLSYDMKHNKDELCVANKDTVIECSFDYKDVFPTKKMVFEGVEVAVPKNPENVLKSMYGDFMRLPKLEDRKPHFDKVVFLDTH